MPAILQFLVRNLLPQFNNSEKMENKGGDATNERSLAVVGLIVALFAFLLAIRFNQRSRFSHPASALSPSPFVRPRSPLKKAPKILLPNPNRSTTIPPADLARANYFFFFNGTSDAPFAGANLGTVTLSYQNNGISRGDMRVA